jgi:hypothetical protein
MNKKDPSQLRSRAWFDNPANIDMTALYLERYLNYGLTRAELTSGQRQADHWDRADWFRSVSVQPSSSRSGRAGARRNP